jgi:tetratricopeptide (TPR) repeat protein
MAYRSCCRRSLPTSEAFSPLCPFGERETESLLGLGDRERSRSDYGSALREYRKAASIDPEYALTQYRMGQCYEQMGAVDSARTAYAAARDLDGLRFRASAEENRIVRSIERSETAVIADIDSAFRAHSPNGIPGKGLLWEHVHPTADGYFLLSETWFTAMASIPFASATVREQIRVPISDSVLRAAVRSTPLDAEFAAQIMENLLHRWPFESVVQQAPASTVTDVQRTASLFVHATLRWNEAHYEMADAYLKEKKYSDAVKEYEAVHAYYPDDPFPLTRMGDMYALLGKNDLAADALLQVLDGAETPFIHLKLGVLYAQADLPERALGHLSRAFELDAQSAAHFSPAQFEEGTYYYSLALFKTGQTEEARQTLSMLLENDPDNAKARQLLTKIAKRK